MTSMGAAESASAALVVRGDRHECASARSILHPTQNTSRHEVVKLFCIRAWVFARNARASDPPSALREVCGTEDPAVVRLS